METQGVEDLLLPQEILLSAGVHIGTRVKTRDMEPYIYKVRPDGLFVLDMEKMNARIKVAAKFLARMNQSYIAVASSKRYGRTPVERFCELTGAIADAQIVEEAALMGIPVIAFCSTDNSLKNIDLVIPMNNKGRRSLAIAYWLLCRQLKRELNELSPEADWSVSIDDFETNL